MRIGLDVDGCVYQWSTCVRRLLKEYRGIEVPEPTSWDWPELPKEHWEWIRDEMRHEVFTQGNYYPGARDAIQTLVDDKHDVGFISATPESVRAARAKLLFEDFPGIAGVNFVSPIKGTEHCRKTFVECDYYLDDKFETALATAEDGHVSLLMNRPWNEKFTIPVQLDVRLIRVYDWDHVVEEINKWR